MKAILKKVVVLVTLLSFSLSFGQTYSEEPSEEVNGEEIVIDNATVSPEILTSLGFEQHTDRTTALQGNLVRVQQIGESNTVNIATATGASDITVNQLGNFNNAQLQYRSQNVFVDLSQQGNSNIVLDFVSDPSASPQLELIQDGSNLSFERFGTNSLTESLKFKQTSASPSIIVRSYN